MSKVDRAVAAAQREVAQMLGQEYDRRSVRITQFARHPDGYLHARITLSGDRTLYVHRRYGSWFCPGQFGGKQVLKEVLAPYSFMLAEKARQYQRQEREAVKAAADAALAAVEAEEEARNAA